jgi:5'-nucleotidase/UDP-sugar diphosphatase
MKILFKVLFKVLFTALILLIFACNPSKKLNDEDALIKQDDGIIEFQFFHINDVYEIAALENGKAGGMARVTTIFKELKAKNPNTFFIHAGDFLNPFLLGTLKYKGKRIRRKQMVEAMDASGVDLVTFGNHEFDIKEKDLQND